MTKITLAVCLLTSLSLGACKDSSSGDGDGNIKVFKYSGSRQCEPDSGTPVDQMVLELTSAGIDVLCAQTGNDGMAYPTVCGASTGEINIYLIRTVNLEDAENLGFASVLTLPDYGDQACPI